jgi:hypothetical protein
MPNLCPDTQFCLVYSYLIAEDVVQNADSDLATLLSYPFFVYSPESFCLFDLLSTYRRWYNFFFTLYNSTFGGHQIYILIYTPAFLELFLA